MEDDLHQNNFSKYGWRIDFDMSQWPILYQYKESLLAKMVRTPNIDYSKVTENDLVNFPNLIDFNPFYWPTKSIQISTTTPSGITTTAYETAKQYLSKNAYPKNANAIYEKLKNNLIFKHHYYTTLLKYILIPEEVFFDIAALHLRKDAAISNNENKLIIDAVKNMQVKRSREFTETLLKIPEFAEFIQTHGEQIHHHLIAAQGIKYKDKIEKTYVALKQESEITLNKLNKIAEEDFFVEEKNIKNTPVFSLIKAIMDFCQKHTTVGYLGSVFRYLALPQ